MEIYQNYKQNIHRTFKTQDIHYNKANQEWSRVSEHMDINEFKQSRISNLSSKQVLICLCNSVAPGMRRAITQLKED